MFLTAIVCSSLIGTADRATSADEFAGDGRGILRFDPLTDRLVPVPPEEAKVGHVYSHFSHHLNRRVWSYLRPSGDFWYAMGPGTTQKALRFDVNATRQEGMDRLQEIAPNVASRKQRTGGKVYFRLNTDDQWVLANTASHATIFNAETGHRWEWIYGKYIPVVSSYGRRWVVDANRYVPMQRAGLMNVASPAAGGCGCD
jgi:hypothetical protein